MVSRPIWERIARDIFLCMGGVLILMATVPLIAPLIAPNSAAPADWNEVPFYAVWLLVGTSYGLCGYAIHTRKRWSPIASTIVSSSILLLLATGTGDPGPLVVIVGGPMTYTLVWGLANRKQAFSPRRTAA